MLDKTILVFYINVGNIDYADVSRYINNMADQTAPAEEDKDKIIRYFLPVRDEPSRVECINNPTFVLDKKLHKSLIEKLEKTNDNLLRITSSINAHAETRNVKIEKIKK